MINMKKKKSKTSLMRVPDCFKTKAESLSRKYGYDATTKFLEQDGVKVLENADIINDFFGSVWNRKKRKK